MQEAAVRIAAALAEVEVPDASLGSAAADDYLALRVLRQQLEVLELRRLAALDAAGIGTSDGSVSTAAWLRRHTRCSGGAAKAEVQLARRLHTDPIRPMVTTAQMLDDGAITVGHAHVIARASASMNGEAFEIAEPAVADAVASLGVDAARQVAEQACRHAQEQFLGRVEDPREERRQAAMLERHLDVSPVGEMWAVNGLLSSEAGQALKAVLDPLSSPAPAADLVPDLRTATQRRADAFGDAMALLLASDRLPVRGGHRPQVTVLVDVRDLAGGAGAFTDGARLTAGETAKVLCDARVGWVAIRSAGTAPDGTAPDGTAPDGTGLDRAGLDALLRDSLRRIAPSLGGSPSQVLDAGRSARLVTPGQRQVLAVRDRGCVFPGCDRPPEWCDAHHLVPWSEGGPTDLDNLVLVCARHHTAVHADDRHQRWVLTRAPDGTVSAHHADAPAPAQAPAAVPRAA